MKWKDKYNKWKFNHDFSIYTNRNDIDEVIVNKMAELLNEQEEIINSLQTTHNKKYTAPQATPKSCPGCNQVATVECLYSRLHTGNC